MRDVAIFGLFGALFGFVLSRGGAADYNMIQGMLLLTEFQVWGLMIVAVIILVPGLALLKRYGRTATGAPLLVRPKAAHSGNVVGGVLFGVGWAVTGACPGPIFVNLGEGKLYAVGTFAGVLVGAWLVGRFYPALSARLGMPALVAPEVPATTRSG